MNKLSFPMLIALKSRLSIYNYNQRTNNMPYSNNNSPVAAPPAS